jgi:hypothetical protein
MDNTFDEPDFLTFKINGHEFEVDAFKANDEIQSILSARKNDPDDSREFLDDIAQLLRTEYGVGRAGRQAAAYFFNRISDHLVDLKKKLGTPAESPESTASTLAIGAE